MLCCMVFSDKVLNTPYIENGRRGLFGDRLFNIVRDKWYGMSDEDTRALLTGTTFEADEKDIEWLSKFVETHGGALQIETENRVS